MNNEIGKQKLSLLSANIAFAGFTAPKILWLRDEEPENYAKIAKIILPKDYVNDILTGIHACDYSDASGILLMGCMLSAASCNKWLLEDIFGANDHAAEQAPITKDKLGENSVVFLPYLMRGRSPTNDTNARGTFTGTAYAENMGAPELPGSGHQEYLESIVNNILFCG